MTKEQAIALCEEQRNRLQIDPEMTVESATKAIVRYKENPQKPGPVEDRLAWIVTYACAWGMAFVHVDDRRGNVLTVKRTA